MLVVGETIRTSTNAYVVEAKHAEGGFGIAYTGTREGDGARIILKELRLERLKDWKAVELFEREAAIMRKLEHLVVEAAWLTEENGERISCRLLLFCAEKYLYSKSTDCLDKNPLRFDDATFEGRENKKHEFHVDLAKGSVQIVDGSIPYSLDVRLDR